MRATETRYKDKMQIFFRNICVFSREITVFDYHRCGDYRAEWSIRWILCIQEIDRHIFFFFLAKQKEKLSCELVSPHTYWYNQSIDRVWSNLQNKEHQQTYRSVSSWNVRCTSMLLSNNNYICASVGMLHFHSTVGSHRQLVQATDTYAVDSSAHQQHIICTSCVHSHKRAIWMIDQWDDLEFARLIVRSFAHLRPSQMVPHFVADKPVELERESTSKENESLPVHEVSTSIIHIFIAASHYYCGVMLRHCFLTVDTMRCVHSV